MSGIPQSRTVRVSPRGKRTTTYYRAQQIAERTLTVRQATPEELANRPRDPNRQVAYQPPIVGGTIVV